MTILRIGSKGPRVLELTDKLVRVGLIKTPTEKFDAQVERAVRAWQVHGVDDRGRKLQVDGLVGPLTWASFELDPDAVFDKPVPESFYEVTQRGGSVIGRTALQFAIGEMELGAREIGANNAGPFVDKYHRQAMDEKQWAWCAAFTSWCFWKASKLVNQPMPFEYTVGAQHIHRQLEKAGMTYDASDENPPQPGDICVWWRGVTRTWKGHVGIVWGYKNGIIYIVEGNVGPYPARVRVFDYVLSRMDKLIGFARPEVSVQMCVLNGDN